jgi:hypothetical protein
VLARRRVAAAQQEQGNHRAHLSERTKPFGERNQLLLGLESSRPAD